LQAIIERGRRSYQAVEGFVSPVFAGRFPKFKNSKLVLEHIPAFAHTHIMSSPDSNGEKIPNHGSGHLEISEKGFGFLRTAANPSFLSPICPNVNVNCYRSIDDDSGYPANRRRTM